MAKRALCVGINLYLDPANNLRGCRNDAFDMAAFFQVELGLLQKDVTILLDKVATKANIMATLRKLVEVSETGDYLAYSHSSHGTQVLDTNGDEPDDYDEALCCYNTASKSGGWDPSTIIIDDELRELFKQLQDGVLLECWFDTCHSGSALRKMGQTYDKARIMLPYDGDIGGQPKKMLGLTEHNQSVLWAACEASKLSADTYLDNKWCGAFTNAFLTTFHPDATRSSLLSALRRKLVEGRYDQIPQLDTVGAMLKSRRAGK